MLSASSTGEETTSVAISRHNVKFPAKMKAECGLGGQLLMLGVQDVFRSKNDMERALQESGVTPKQIPQAARKYSHSRVQTELSPSIGVTDWGPSLYSKNH